jgi:uncharacterized protein (TIGR03083 family)
VKPQRLAPILTAHLFPSLEVNLVELLRSLTSDEWEAPTIAGKWTVRDVAAHLLDTQLRRLSGGRDRHFREETRVSSDEDLIALVNTLNAEGVQVYGRLSGNVLIALLEATSAQLCQYFDSLDPFAMGLGVSWAGETRSPNWFDGAREFTERWHHQQQIRLAVGKPGIMTREFTSRCWTVSCAPCPTTTVRRGLLQGHCCASTLPARAAAVGTFTEVRVDGC